MSAIFIDLDGTLIDPKVGITSSIQHALRELDAEVPSADELSFCIGPPLWDSFRALLGERADVSDAVNLYREHFTDTGMFEADVYDGIGEMLTELRELGLPLYVATSKPHVYATTITEHFGLSHYIDGLFGSELDGTNSDKTDLLAHALAETGADPFKSLMIGDRRYDIEGAQNNDIRTIGVLWGYADEGELHLAEAEALAGAPEDIGEIAAEMLGVE
ncbi:MAG: HAD hydrolase-like protein [Alphaproteobacteria bacterium]|nr:HAD hydrolase-like protein [Alphaproteobacteria bacterium]